MARETVLIIEDEPDTVDLIRCNLRTWRWKVIAAGTGTQGLKKAQSALPDLIVLDLMLPDQDGFEVCKALKANARTALIPLIILSGRATEMDRVLGLELGADDYVVKPFSVRELTLRIDHLLRKRLVRSPVDPEYMRFGDLAIDKGKFNVTVNGKPVHLTPTEFKLLTCLAEHCERIQNREGLLRQVCVDGDLLETQTIDGHIRRLRAKLGPAAKHISTLRGVGYRFVESP